MRKYLLSALLLCLSCGVILGQEAGRTTPPAPAQPSSQGQPPSQSQPTAQGQPPSQRPPAKGQGSTQPQSPSGTPATTGTRPEAKTADQAVFVLDVNPIMWILSGIPDENNNRSVFFDIGIQWNLYQDISLRLNPSFSFGFTGETAFSDSPINFFEFEFPFTFLCFPFPKGTYLSPAFFGISIVCTYHSTMYDDSDDTVFMSIGAMMELGYQFMFSNRLTITPSIGISRMFPKPINGGTAAVPNFNIYSPWTADTAVAPRVRITLGFWL